MHRSRSSNTMEAKLKAQTHESDCMRGRKCPMPLIGARERSGRVTGRQPGGMASLLNKPLSLSLSLSLWPAGVIGEGRWLRVPETLAELPWRQVLGFPLDNSLSLSLPLFFFDLRFSGKAHAIAGQAPQNTLNHGGRGTIGCSGRPAAWGTGSCNEYDPHACDSLGWGSARKRRSAG